MLSDITWDSLVERCVLVLLRGPRDSQTVSTATLAVTRVYRDLVRDSRLQLGHVELHNAARTDIANQEPELVAHLGVELLWQAAVEPLDTTHPQSSEVFVEHWAVSRGVGNAWKIVKHVVIEALYQ